MYLRNEMNDKKIWISIAAISGFTAVALGAFGAHGLKAKLTEEMLEVFKTGIFYHLIHTIVILAIAFTDKIKGTVSMIFFLAGIFLFSFSLYFYSVLDIKIFAFITPIGGVAFLMGWLFLAGEVFRRNKVNR